jgi:serine/threonine-protein kinase
MSYCVNPSCPEPKNPDDVLVCQACGSSLQLKRRYNVLGILGKGGFGATFAVADQELPGKPICVIKQLRPTTDDPNVFRMAKELFEREAETLGKIGNHPQIPRLLDYFEENQHFYLVQEYVKGHNLHQEVRKRGAFTEAGVKQFLSELLPIISYIHSQKVIHRDIKPANLIRRQTDRKLVLIDFGAVKNQVNTVVSHHVSSQTALTNFAVGTPVFAPPEQMAMRPVYASDIYALGVTCIYLLTAKSPKDFAIDQNTGELIWEHEAQVSPMFAKVLKTMMETSVAHRYKTAEEVLQALDMSAYSDSLAESLITSPIGPLGKSSPATETKEDVSLVTDIKSNLSQASKRLTPVDQAGSAQNINVTPGMMPRRKSTASELTLLKKKPKLDAKKLLEEFDKGNTDFAQEDLSGLNLQKAHIPGIIFYQAQLNHVNLQGADLTQANLGKANLSQGILKNANLCQAYMSYANLERADLRGADLTGANLNYASLRGANLCGANLCDAKVTPEQLALAKVNWLTVMPSGKRGFW